MYFEKELYQNGVKANFQKTMRFFLFEKICVEISFFPAKLISFLEIQSPSNPILLPVILAHGAREGTFFETFYAASGNDRNLLSRIFF